MPNIVHLGIGNFHRAHQAWYTQRANACGGDQWQIIGVSLRRPDMRDSLAPANFEYTLAIKSGENTQFERMRVHSDILVAPENPSAIIDMIANDDTKIITLTITEKGYHRDETTGQIKFSSSDIADELGDQKPRTAIGFLAFGLAARMACRAGPITLISCDNLPDNGHTLEALVTTFADHANLGIGEYLKANVTFPSTMVDRIVPSTTDELRREVQSKTGSIDTSPVATEPFSQWVIEDRFASTRPQWEDVGVTFVDDVAPYELAKLRLLNGPHSLLAYAGILAGHKYVHQAIKDVQIRTAVKALMAEATSTLPSSIQAQAPDYCDALIARFENPSLGHELAQIAQDGSQKIPVRIVPVIRALGGKSRSPAATRCIAAWAEFVKNKFVKGEKIVDPMNEQLRTIFDQSNNPEEFAQTLKTKMFQL